MMAKKECEFSKQGTHDGGLGGIMMIGPPHSSSVVTPVAGAIQTRNYGRRKYHLDNTRLRLEITHGMFAHGVVPGDQECGEMGRGDKNAQDVQGGVISPSTNPSWQASCAPFHIWELPGNYRDFIMVMVFYLFRWRTKRIIVTATTGFKIYILIQSLMLFI